MSYMLLALTGEVYSKPEYTPEETDPNDPSKILHGAHTDFWLQNIKVSQNADGEMITSKMLVFCQAYGKFGGELVSGLEKGNFVQCRGFMRGDEKGKPFIYAGDDDKPYAVFTLVLTQLGTILAEAPRERVDMHVAVVMGFLGRDVELKYTKTGQAVANGSIAVNIQSGETKETLWIRYTLWGAKAERAPEFLTKGKAILLEGTFQFDPETGGPSVWEGQKGIGATYEMTAYKWAFAQKREDGPTPEFEKPAGLIEEQEQEIPF